MVDKGRRLTRDEKLENLVMNHSMILMSMFEEAFSTLADKMTETLAKGTTAMAKALAEGLPRGSDASGTVDIDEKVKYEIPPEVRTQIGYLFSEIREEIASQWPKNAIVFAQYVSAPAFDEGIKIVEKHDFGRPKLTEKLSDGTLASYVFLLQSGDKELGSMFKELADWQANLPKPPWRP